MHIESLESRRLMSQVPIAEAANADIGGRFTSLSSTPLEVSAYGLATAEKRRAEQLTSLFENSTPDLQYGYIQNLHDGRGLTAGRAGFCTGTGDFYEVVRRYTDLKPDNRLARFLHRLERLAERGSPSTARLAGIKKAWRKCALDADFRAVQDSVVDDYYYTPAMTRAQTVGLTYALSKAQLYDAIIQQGEGDDPDGLPAMITRANTQAGGPPASGVPETSWLRAFLDVRIQTLTHPTDPATAKAWADSVDRVQVFATLLDQNNLGLTGTIDVTVYGDRFLLVE